MFRVHATERNLCKNNTVNVDQTRVWKLTSFFMKIAHLSDLHFNRSISVTLLESLRRDIESVRPDVITVSGDITDRGRNHQYRLALDFLKSLGSETVVAPGNRDVCASTFWEWMSPRFSMRRYRSYMGNSDRIIFKSDIHKVIIIGLNSVHFFPSWPGTISRESRYWFRDVVARHEGYFKALALHHPVAPVIYGSSFWAHQLSDAAAILRICFENGVRLVMQGHKHRSSFLELREPRNNSSVVVSSCGAPLAPDGDRIYHVIEIGKDSMIATPREFENDHFEAKATYTFDLNA